MSDVISQDGTRIAYERLGSGPPVVLIDGALCSREFGPMPQIASLLTPNFTVCLYDRRGRGASGDTQPYAKAREVEDVQALIAAAGGSAFVFGTSSGAGLALEAAASGANIAKLAVYEPPFIGAGQANHEQRLKSFVAAGQRAAALKYFMRDMVGAPACKTPARLRTAVETLVKVLPNVRHRELPGQTHNVSPAVLVPVLREFFRENAR